MRGSKGRGRRWTKATLIEKIKGLPDGARNAKSASRYDDGFYQTACKYFGDWGKALEASGFASDTDRKSGRVWSEATVIAEIQALQEGSRNARSVEMCSRSLYDAALHRFGQWDAALVASGFDPKAERKREKWTKERVIERVKSLPPGGRNAKAVEIQDANFYTVAMRRFKTWDSVLVAAGIDPKGVSTWSLGQQAGRSFEYVLRELLREVWPVWIYKGIRKNGCAPDWKHVVDDVWLDAKLRSHGPDVESSIEKYILQVPALMIIYARGRREDKDRFSHGGRVAFLHVSELQSLPISNVGNVLYREACAFEDDAYVWSENSEYHRAWTETKLLEAIRKLQGTSLRAGVINKEDSGLYRAARLHFGGWDEALLRTGVEPADVRGWRNSSPESIIAEIRKLPSGKRNSGYVAQTHSRLHQAAARVYGNWYAAVEAAGFDPKTERKNKSKWSSDA